MPAIKKSDDTGLHEAPHEIQQAPDTGAESPVALENAQASQGAGPVESPARTLQQRLHDALHVEDRRELMWDVGRVLASASGITTLLGVFFYYGIW